MTETAPWARSLKSLGIIGMGGIGRSIGARLLIEGRAHGLQRIAVYDPEASAVQGLEDLGAVVCPSVARLAETADIILICQSGSAEVGRIARSHEGLLDSLRRGQIVVDHSWSSLALTRQLATAFAKRGGAFIDAPIGRSDAVAKAVEAGRLAVAVAGDKAPVDAAMAPLRGVAGSITHVGPSGAAQVVRQMGDMVAMQTFAALAEALMTARAFGVDGDRMLDAFASGHGDSATLGRDDLAELLGRDDALIGERTSIADAGQRLKNAIQLAESQNLRLNGAGSTSALLDGAIENGLGSEGLSRLFEAVETAQKKPSPAAQPRRRAGSASQ